METVVRGYRVYGADWEAPVGQILPCQREGGNIHDPYAVAVVEEGVVVGHAPALNENFRVKTFANCPKTAKFAKVFTRERFPLYGMLPANHCLLTT